jgi:soluble lytic murein transglycosylase
MLLRLLFFCAVLVGISVYWRYWREHRYDKEIIAAAQKYQVSPALVKAVVWQETRFNASARGRAGEIGLMQIREPAAQEWAKAERIQNFAHEMIFDPAINTQAGTWYLAKLLKRYGHTDNPIPYALADYNAGRANVLRWNKNEAATNSAVFIEQITFPGTKNYARNVMERSEYYRKRF